MQSIRKLALVGAMACVLAPAAAYADKGEAHSATVKQAATDTTITTKVKAAYAKDPAKAAKMATDPLGPAPNGADVADLAAWTVVANVLLNLDEMLMRR